MFDDDTQSDSTNEYEAAPAPMWNEVPTPIRNEEVDNLLRQQSDGTQVRHS